jgi:hypothetical protein
VNPELENIRGALWATYFDLKEERISAEEAWAADALLATLGRVLELELEQEQEARKDQAESAKPPTPTTERIDSE